MSRQEKKKKKEETIIKVLYNYCIYFRITLPLIPNFSVWICQHLDITHMDLIHFCPCYYVSLYLYISNTHKNANLIYNTCLKEHFFQFYMLVSLFVTVIKERRYCRKD